MTRSVRYDAVEERFEFGPVSRPASGADVYAHVTDLTGHSAVDVQAALRSASRNHHGVEATMNVSEVELRYFDNEDSPVEPVAFIFDGRALFIEVESLQNVWEDEDDKAFARVGSILRPLLVRSRAALSQAGPSPWYQGPPWLWSVRILPSLRGRSLEELYGLGCDAVALLEAASGGVLTRSTVLDLVRAGHARVLVGQPEGPWLDAKSQHYDLSTTGGKIALAQAVARFANAEHGGIVVVGMQTKKVPGGEEIRSIQPVPREPGMIRKYQHALEQHLFPPPDFLDIERVDVPNGMLVVVHVPPQPEELKPFLVHGAIVDGRTEGAFISIVRRRGESSIPITAPALHSMLAAGRALLRRGDVAGQPGLSARADAGSSGDAKAADSVDELPRNAGCPPES